MPPVLGMQAMIEGLTKENLALQHNLKATTAAWERDAAEVHRLTYLAEKAGVETRVEVLEASVDNGETLWEQFIGWSRTWPRRL